MIAICVILVAFGSDAVRRSDVVALESPPSLNAGSQPEGLEIFLNTSTSGIAMAMDESDAPGLPVMLQGSLREDIASYIITMKDRRKLVTDSFRSMGLEYEDSIFEALGPDNVNMANFRKSSECKQLCQGLSNGEIGCELSHVAILRDFLSKDNYKYCMVFEDDARLNPAVHGFFTKAGDKSVKETLARMADTHKKFEWNQLNLGACWGTCSEREYLNISLPEPVKIAANTNSFCTVAYMVSRKGAEILLEEVQKLGLQAADKGIRRTKPFKHVTLEPRLFDQDKKHTSAIHAYNGLNTPQYRGRAPCINSDLVKQIGHK
ncbi:hypothetical protein AAMO2058_000131900 [Amorphochlora amoebiformis]